jgi:glyoxylase-like metal-dependent hydrolase (beta-lactamase superfamily II)
MNISRFPLGELQTNCYIIAEDNHCLIIDPADSADFILEEVQRRNLEVLAVFATHGHFDHILAAGELQMSLELLYQKNLPLYISEEDLFLVKRVKETAEHFLHHSPKMLPIQHYAFLKPGVMNMGNFEFNVLGTPGHTPGSSCFLFPTDSVIFTGDTLFKDAVGDYSHQYSNKKELYKSVKQILSLDEGITLYPGHGEEELLQNTKNALSYIK